MIFRLSVLVAILALVAGQRPPEAERNSQEVSARLMQATAGVSGINSQTSGLVTAIGRTTLGGEAVQNGATTNLLTQWTYRFVIGDGVRDGQMITGVGLHCGANSPTEAAPLVQRLDASIEETEGVLDGGAQLIGARPDVVNFLVTTDGCYLNVSTSEYPSGELRANLQCNLATTDSGELDTCPSSANTLVVSTGVVLSVLAGVAALF